MVSAFQDPNGTPGDADDINRSLTLVALSLDDINIGNDTVSGTSGEEGTVVNVNVGNDMGDFGKDTTVAAGNWSADFTGEFDIDENTGAQARIYELDGDATIAEPVQPSVITGSLTGDWIEGWNFPPMAPVDIEINGADPGTGTGLSTDNAGNFFADAGFLEGFFGRVTTCQAVTSSRSTSPA